MWCIVRRLRQKFQQNLLKNHLNRNNSAVNWLCSSPSDKTDLPDGIKFPNGDRRLERYLDRLKEKPTNPNKKKVEFIVSIVQNYEYRRSIVDQYKELINEMQNENEKEFLSMVNDEKERFVKVLHKIDESLIEEIILLNDDDNSDVSSFMLEIQAGVGGQEAMLFARVLFDMYENFLKYKQWQYDILEENHSDMGGIRSGSIIVRDGNAFELFQYEGGVHRVQRVPKTERTGRIHTSTAVVLVIPCPDDINIDINPADLRIETKRASGPGGQSVNKLESAVRIVHLPTGIAVDVQEERTQYLNKSIALTRLRNKLYQIEFTKQASSQSNMRKNQIGARSRNEKLRTYNYPQRRVTDHRLGSSETIHNLDEFLNGNHHLDELMEKIAKIIRKQKLEDLLDNQT